MRGEQYTDGKIARTNFGIYCKIVGNKGAYNVILGGGSGKTGCSRKSQYLKDTTTYQKICAVFH